LSYALLLNQSIKGRAFIRTAIYLPSVTSSVAISLIFIYLYNNGGAINAFLSIFHIHGPDWLNDPSTALPAIMIMNIYTTAPTFMILFLAALQGLPATVYEAARIDGAGGFTLFRTMTLPLLRPTMFLVVAVGTIGSFQTFDQVAVMTQGGPLNATVTPVWAIYDTAFKQYHYGLGASMASDPVRDHPGGHPDPTPLYRRHRTVLRRNAMATISSRMPGATTSPDRQPPSWLTKVAIIYILLLVFSFIALAPFVYAVLSSFKTPDKVLEYPPSFIPNPWTFSNFSDLFNKGGSDVHFARWLFNSLFYGVAVAALNLFFSSMAAVRAGPAAVSRARHSGSSSRWRLMMIPGEINWISVYIILNHFGPFNLIDTYWAVILPLAAQPFSVFLLTQFLKGLPVEIEEAATIDGASKFPHLLANHDSSSQTGHGCRRHPQLQGAWNAFVQPLLYLNSSTKFPLTVGLNFFNGQYSSHTNLILAGAMFNTIPMVIIFFIFQRYFIQGAATSGLGGR